MKKNLNPFDKIDPLLIKEKEDQFIKKFLKFIENKNKQELLQIQKFINQKGNHLEEEEENQRKEDKFILKYSNLFIY